MLHYQNQEKWLYAHVKNSIGYFKHAYKPRKFHYWSAITEKPGVIWQAYKNGDTYFKFPSWWFQTLSLIPR